LNAVAPALKAHDQWLPLSVRKAVADAVLAAVEGEDQPPASTAPLAAGLPLVQGHCPACGSSSLFLGHGGYVTCSRIDCPQPQAASQMLGYGVPAEYPHQDGDVTVLGPEIFASSNGDVICWKGENYTRQPATPAPTDDRRQQYTDALWPLTDWDGDILNAEAAADAVIAVADREQQHLLDLLGEAVDWIHEGELRDRITAALNPHEQP
jgi:hypothetical protein